MQVLVFLGQMSESGTSANGTVLARTEISISAEVIRGFFGVSFFFFFSCPGGVSGLGSERWKTLVPGCFQERKASEDGGASAVGEDRWSRARERERVPIGLTLISLMVLGEMRSPPL